MTDIQKRAYDKRLFDIDLGPAMRAQDTIAMIDAIVEIGTSDLTIDDFLYSGAVVTFSVSGGISGCEYKIAIRWATEGAPMQTLETTILLAVFAE